MKLVHGAGPEGKPEPPAELSETDLRALWAQFAHVYAEAQKEYDTSIRTLAAGGVAVTASIATAFHAFGASGAAAIVLFLVGLGATVASHGSAQFDASGRIGSLRSGDVQGVHGNKWTKVTTTLNALAGIALVAGGIMLAVFVSMHA